MLIQLSPSEISDIQSRYGDLINYESEDISTPIDPMNYKDSGGDSLMHIAVLRGDMVTVSLLLKAGLDPNTKGDMGNTPLHYAAEQKNPEIFAGLKKYGASSDIANDFGSLARIATQE